MIVITHDLDRLSDRLLTMHSDIKEVIVRTYTDHHLQIFEELVSKFGENLRYTKIKLNVYSDNFSIEIDDVNEYALSDRSGADAQTVADYAAELFSNKIIELLKETPLFREGL